MPGRPEPRSAARAIRALVLLALGLAAVPADAHKLQVFAFAEGARIQGSAYFAGGAKAQGVRVKVEGGDGRVLAELTTDPDGTFSYVAESPGDYRIVADSRDGHRAEWRISAAELEAGFAQGPGPAVDPARGSPLPRSASPPVPSSPPQPTATGPALDPVLESMIERAVARQVRPLREELLAAQDQARLRDILGGIGYILGLTGLALWWRARRPGPPR